MNNNIIEYFLEKATEVLLKESGVEAYYFLDKALNMALEIDRLPKEES